MRLDQQRLARKQAEREAQERAAAERLKAQANPTAPPAAALGTSQPNRTAVK
jgi:hypothetical protein